jgi:uncharacterized membrane protein YjjP (DUF1212 family)
MGKRHPNLPAWQWKSHPQNHQYSPPQALNLIAAALFIIGFLLLVSGVFSLSPINVVIGVIGVIAALGIQRRGHSLKA